MSPQNGPNFMTYKTSNFLDTVCHQNVSTDTDFSHIEQTRTFIFCLKAKILWEFFIT
jgi:hypothetical protein